MKVLQVIDTLNVGGAEQITVSLSNLLHENNINVELLLLTENDVLIKNLINKISIIRLDRKNKYNLSKLYKVAKLIEKFDIIHVHLKHNYRYVKLSSLLFNFDSDKIILHDHSHYKFVSKNKIRGVKDFLFKNILKPKFYIGVSEENCNWAKIVLKLSSDRVFKLTNFITKKKCTENKKKNSDEFVLISNITRIKNIEFALRLISSLNAKLTIYGHIYDYEYYDELKKIIKRLNITNDITFVSGAINLQCKIKMFNFALLTSHKETGPIVVIEYLAQSIPFLAYDTGEVADKIRKDLPLHLINNFNIQEWKKRISILKKETNREYLEKVYSDYFNPQNYLKECKKIYQEIINF